MSCRISNLTHLEGSMNNKSDKSDKIIPRKVCHSRRERDNKKIDKK